MRQVRIQKRSRLTVALVAAMAASALLSAFQPASAGPEPVGPLPGTGMTVPVPIVGSGRAFSTSVQQGEFQINVGVYEGSGLVCASITNTHGEAHRACAHEADTDVSDTLASAYGRGTSQWSTEVGTKGRYKTPTYKYGTLTIDASWTGTGDTITHLEAHDLNTNVGCWVSLSYDGSGCAPGLHFYQSRTATWSATITDSEWGTFVVNGGRGYLYQSTF